MTDFINDDESSSINIHKDFLGQAGEHLTAGKLLLNGFNVYHGAIDDGIDIVASKDNKFYKIQVKTCQDIAGYDSGRFMASVNLSTLSKHDVQSTFVVFVVHYLSAQASLDSAGNHNVYDQDFIVLPAQKLFDLTGSIDGKAVLRVKSTLVTNDNGEGYIYKMAHRGVELILDDYLIESFAQIVERGEE